MRSLVRNFNDYLGAGALGGTSHLYHLVTTTELRTLVDGRYEGPLYTTATSASRFAPTGAHDAARRAASAAARPGPQLPALKRAGCPRCRGERFIPLARSVA